MLLSEASRSSSRSATSCRLCTLGQKFTMMLLIAFCGLLITTLQFAAQDTKLSSDDSDLFSAGNQTLPAAHGFEGLYHEPSQEVLFSQHLMMPSQRRQLYSVDVDIGAVTAIIPVTSATITDLSNITEPLFADDSSVTGIVIVCPSELLPVLNAVILEVSATTFLDIAVFDWKEGLEESFAVLSAVSYVATDYALLLDHKGLGGLNYDAQRHLLSHPLLLELPVGICGVKILEGVKNCVFPSSDLQQVNFLVPPLVLPTSLLVGYNATVDVSLNPWESLGATFGDPIGGIVQQGTGIDNSWCARQCQNLLDDVCLSSLTETTSRIKTEKTFVPSSIAMILPTVLDLEHFSSAACKLQNQGIHTHVLVLSHQAEHDEPRRNSTYPWLHQHLISRQCQFSYSALHESHNLFANAEAASYWLDTTNSSHSSIIIGIHGDRVSALDVDLDKRRADGTTVIRIPTGDLRYSDWIGTLTELELANWHIPQISISVITDDRPASLSRLLSSIDISYFYGDDVDLRLNMEDTAGPKTREMVENFIWSKGSTFVHQRVTHGDLLPAVVESWFPQSNDTYGVILEDDVEVSPLFYAWAKLVILRYRYGSDANRMPSMFGLSLYQQKNLELHPEGRKLFNARSLFHTSGLSYDNSPFLSQIPCSWGAVYFPEQWREFHSYLRHRLAEAWIPLRQEVVPKVRSNKWTRSWKKYFIELAYLRGYVMLYPNYENYLSLSTNHLEPGSHVKLQPQEVYEQKKKIFTLPLLRPADVAQKSGLGISTGLLDLPEERLPEWSELPVLDLLGAISSSQQLIEQGLSQQTEVADCETVASEVGRQRTFEARDLFACGGEDFDVFEDLDAIRYDS